MRVLLVIAVFAAALAATAGAAGPVPTQPAFVVDGGGWGHGVGMSQWGAYGQALKGRTHAQILVVRTTRGRPWTTHRRARCASLSSQVRRASSSPQRCLPVRDGAGAVHQFPAGELTLGPRLEIDVDGVRTTRARRPGDAVPGRCSRSRAPATGGSSASRATGRRCRRSTQSGWSCTCRESCRARCRAAGRSRRLKAQAVAARTYALANIVKGKPFDLYSDWRSQVYYGVEEESQRRPAPFVRLVGRC